LKILSRRNLKLKKEEDKIVHQNSKVGYIVKKEPERTIEAEPYPVDPMLKWQPELKPAYEELMLHRTHYNSLPLNQQYKNMDYAMTMEFPEHHPSDSSTYNTQYFGPSYSSLDHSTRHYMPHHYYTIPPDETDYESDQDQQCYQIVKMEIPPHSYEASTHIDYPEQNGGYYLPSTKDFKEPFEFREPKRKCIAYPENTSYYQWYN